MMNSHQMGSHQMGSQPLMDPDNPYYEEMYCSSSQSMNQSSRDSRLHTIYELQNQEESRSSISNAVGYRSHY